MCTGSVWQEELKIALLKVPQEEFQRSLIALTHLEFQISVSDANGI